MKYFQNVKMKYIQNIFYIIFIWDLRQTCKVGEVLVEESWPGQEFQGQGVVRVGRVQVGGRGAAGRGGQHLLLQQLLQGRRRNQRRRRAEPRQQRREWRGSWQRKIFLLYIKYFPGIFFAPFWGGGDTALAGCFLSAGLLLRRESMQKLLVSFSSFVLKWCWNVSSLIVAWGSRLGAGGQQSRVVIVKTDCETDGSSAALVTRSGQVSGCTAAESK